MAFSELLESFDTDGTEQGSNRTEINQVALENERLASFETGYSAGWEDAVKAQADDQTRVSSDLAQNLQDMSFTYHEAVAHLNKSIEPLLQDIVAKVLPQMAKETLGMQIVEQLAELARVQTGAAMQITVSPTNLEAVENLVGEALQEPFEITSEPSLGDGQAYIKFGTAEREIDTGQLIEGIQSAMTAFIHQNNKEPLRA